MKNYFDSHCEERSDEAISLFVSYATAEIASWRWGATRNDTESDFFNGLLETKELIKSYAQIARCIVLGLSAGLLTESCKFVITKQ